MMSSWQRRAAAVAALAVPALVVAGCTSSTPGTASNGTSTSVTTGGPASGGSASGSATPTSGKSTRPRSIDLKSVDLCQILTAQQRQQLGLDGNPTPGEDKRTFVGAKLCSIRDSAHDTSVLLTAVTTFGIGTFTDGSRRVQTEPTQVAGFPALVLRLANVEYCSVVVDVADGQFFLAMFSDNNLPRKVPAEQLCPGAQRAAEAAMASLKGGG